MNETERLTRRLEWLMAFSKKAEEVVNISDLAALDMSGASDIFQMFVYFPTAWNVAPINVPSAVSTIQKGFLPVDIKGE